MSATLGHTQSLHTNALDEAIALPTDFTARIARNTQIFLLEETNITKVIDPWAGSYYVEYLTHQLIEKAWNHIVAIENLGGMAKAIESGVPKLRIEEASARKQARIDSGLEIIVGVNKFNTSKATSIEVLDIDNTAVRNLQIKRLNELKMNRNQNEVDAALNALTICAETGEGNLLDLSIKAARAKATLGEISDAIEKVSGRYNPQIMSISGVYGAEFGNKDEINDIIMLADKFDDLHGRRPRILIAKMGQDGHDRGAKVVATAYADMGFDVDIGPLFQTPQETALQAIENDVHIIGVSSLAAGHKTLVPELIAELDTLGRNDIMIICGGVIPAQDYDFLYHAGVSAIFGPGTKLPEAAKKILIELFKRQE
jgi:methylmalonyl-CoA mutase